MPSDDVAAELAAMGSWNYWFLRSSAAEAAYRAGQITQAEWARLDILCVQMTAALDDELPPDTAEDFAAFELGIPLRRARKYLAWTAGIAHKKRPIQIRHTCRPSRHSRQHRRRNIRTRRAKARAPSGDPSPEPEQPLDLLDIAVLVLGWGRV
jgi:hypothetical protein